MLLSLKLMEDENSIIISNSLQYSEQIRLDPVGVSWSAAYATSFQ